MTYRTIIGNIINSLSNPIYSINEEQVSARNLISFKDALTDALRGIEDKLHRLIDNQSKNIVNCELDGYDNETGLLYREESIDESIVFFPEAPVEFDIDYVGDNGNDSLSFTQLVAVHVYIKSVYTRSTKGALPFNAKRTGDGTIRFFYLDNRNLLCQHVLYFVN